VTSHQHFQRRGELKNWIDSIIISNKASDFALGLPEERGVEKLD